MFSYKIFIIMVQTCVVFGCRNRGNDVVKKSFFCIPAILKNQGDLTRDISKERRELWISRIGRKCWIPSQYSKVCSDHFISGKPASLFERNHPDWAPSLKLDEKHKPQHSNKRRDSLERYGRVKKRCEKHINLDNSKFESNIEQRATTLAISQTNHNQPNCRFFVKGRVQAVHSCREERYHISQKQMSDEIRCLRNENEFLKKKLKSKDITEDSFKLDDDKVKYYTGLPQYGSLQAIVNLLGTYITDSVKTSLSKFQKLVMVLMKLRLNLPTQDLAYWFNVSVATVSRTFNQVIHIIHSRLKDFVVWPEREDVRLTMPMEFRKRFGLKVAVIIDCFEVKIERPSSLLARAKTWSNYKHSNTIKFLIGICPQGSVSFLSKAYGGRVSDKYIAEDCGLLEKLLPGDIVLADRGFNISESVGLKCAEVKIPAFTRGKQQLSPIEVESTRCIAHVRIHVERVIGLVRNKYTILQGILPLDYLQSEDNVIPIIDKIAHVCCALTNMCPSVIPFD